MSCSCQFYMQQEFFYCKATLKELGGDESTILKPK